MTRTRTIRIGLAALAACSLVVSVACTRGEDPATRSIGAAALASRIEAGEAPVVLDVRTPEEFASGHIPGAVNVPHGELAGRVGELPTDRGTEIVVHCQSGRRAAAAEEVLREAGFTNVKDLDGHMQAWKAEGRPLEVSPE